MLLPSPSCLRAFLPCQGARGIFSFNLMVLIHISLPFSKIKAYIQHSQLLQANRMVVLEKAHTGGSGGLALL